jgi:hypothetical protein
MGSGIGSCSATDQGSKSSIGSLLISDSQIQAISTAEGSGIGTGPVDGSLSEINDLTILNSTIVATGTGGSGIGTSHFVEDGISAIHTIAISNSTLNSSGGSGYASIGSGAADRPVASIRFMGNCLVECHANWSSPAIRASSILMSAGLLSIVADGAPVFGTTPINNGSAILVIGYHRNTTAESEPSLRNNGAFLHIGDVRAPDSLLGTFRFCVDGVEFRFCFDQSLGTIRSVIVGTGIGGQYRFPAWIGDISRDLIASDGRTRFSVDSAYSFVDGLFNPAQSNDLLLYRFSSSQAYNI